MSVVDSIPPLVHNHHYTNIRNLGLEVPIHNRCNIRPIIDEFLGVKMERKAIAKTPIVIALVRPFIVSSFVKKGFYLEPIA